MLVAGTKGFVGIVHASHGADEEAAAGVLAGEGIDFSGWCAVGDPFFLAIVFGILACDVAHLPDFAEAVVFVRMCGALLGAEAVDEDFEGGADFVRSCGYVVSP